MNENAKKWVAALRSGEFKQGRRVLRRKDRCCCLGVLCELAVKAGVIPEPRISTDDTDDGAYVYGAEHDIHVLPMAVARWAGLKETNGSFRSSGRRQCLSSRNDHGIPFSEIADIIESEPEGLFQTKGAE